MVRVAMRLIVAVLFLVFVHHSRGDDEKIIGGYECKPHSQPWQILLSQEGETVCGASLINRLWAVSAAHCYVPADELVLRLGEHRVFIYEGTEQRIPAEKVIKHPDYDDQTADNDFMLIKLSRPAILNQYVWPIPLASSCAEAGDECVVSGWGNQSIIGESYPSVLKCLNVPVISKAKCKASYGSRITNNMFCAGYLEGGKDACQGDSGGPIVCDGELKGVVSWGDGCALPGLPGVYAEVCRFVDWAEETMDAN